MESANLRKDYSKEKNTATLAKIQALIKENEVSNAEINIRSLYLADGEKTFTKKKDVSCTIKLPIEKKAQANAIRKKLAEDDDLAEIVEVECAVGTGDQFQAVEGVDRPQVGGEENLNIEHEQGTVLLVDFWATWCGPCQGPMAHNQEMLKKNEEKWKGKVRIVGASLDKDRTALINRITERGWDKVDHYILPGNWQHPGPQTYGCNGIPFVVLVNKVGKIVYTGHPSSVNLEEEINKLLEEEPVKTETKTESKATESTSTEKVEKGLPVDTYKTLRGLVKSGGLSSVTELCNEKGFFQVFAVLQHSKTLDANLEVKKVSREKFMVGGAMTSGAAETLKSRLSAATQGLSEEHFIHRLKVLDSVKIEFGTTCNSCSKTLTNKDAQYLSLEEKLYYCKACGDKEDPEKVGVDKYVNPHALIFLSFKDPSVVGEVMKHRVRDQNQPKLKIEEEAMRGHRGVGCDACRQAVGEKKRFKCVTCMDVDVCGDCHEKLLAGDEKLSESLKERGHDVNTHVVQRYCFAEAR